MTFDALMLLLAAGGGFLGAAIGGLNAFIFTGLAVLLGNAIMMAGGSAGFLNTVAFGPFLGPHVAFVGGVAAVAYAGRKAARVAEEAADLAVAPAAVAAMAGAGAADLDRPRDVSVLDLENAGPAPDDAPVIGGKDIGVPLISLEQWDVLLVGVIAGMLGYCVNQVVSAIGWFGTHTDTIAFTVVVMAIATRLLFGRSGLFPKSASRPDGASGWGRFAPYDEARWIKYHERFLPATMLGAFVGLFAAGITVLLSTAYPGLGATAKTFAFGLSALSLIFLGLGVSFPVTHHITLPAGVAAVAFLPVVHGNHTAAILIGAAGGVLGAWLGELFARLWYNQGDTHIDPPAAAIWPATTIILVAAALFS
ncbi:hypothetical protein ATK17_1558 [Branchiibius hedensis]|uniref:DUF7973 domain-containing protein n=1 Tax=Branchiibius hedensis TaxID=672460 RepID=A0A2Y8ZPJ3_9MICO|nr:hypothetical protein [Branchiibius hedensis]PWJ25437.1 hypothetical protein ATK17_1558 [Branchiibius hedensis]SSA34250.1 hypothetical protein SAMN04489750_1558 [Branchiibius hedensis]